MPEKKPQVEDLPLEVGRLEYPDHRPGAAHLLAAGLQDLPLEVGRLDLAAVLWAVVGSWVLLWEARR
jgi:hypothetical protein